MTPMTPQAAAATLLALAAFAVLVVIVVRVAWYALKLVFVAVGVADTAILEMDGEETD